MSSSASATIYFDNATSTVQSEDDIPWSQLAMRETGSGARAGFMIMVPPQKPRYLLVPDQVGQELRVYDLLRPDGPGAAVLHGEDNMCYSAAVSPDGGSILLGCRDPNGLRVYDTARLLEVATALLEGEQAEADDQIAPRGQAPNMTGHLACAGAAFSHDATRLFILWSTASAITVHDTSHPELSVLRELPFSGGNSYYGNFQLTCAGGLLAACAGGGTFSATPSGLEDTRMRRQVKLWRVGVDRETDLCTVSNPDLADAVAIRFDGGLVAVGLRNGVVRLMSPTTNVDMGEEQEELVDLEPMEEVRGDPMVNSLCFSRDGTKLVVGRFGSDDFVVYDVASAAVVARFVQAQSDGFSAAFFPAGDILVTGGWNSQPCVFRRVLGPSPRIDLALSSCADITGIDIVSHDELGSVVAMASGSQLEVHAEGGKKLLQHDLGEQMFTSLSGFRTPVRLHPSGKFVACVLAKKVMVVLSMADCSELLRFDTGGSCFGTAWSPDGAFLAVATMNGARLISVGAGFAEVQHLEVGAGILGCVFDSTGARVATCAQDEHRPGCVTVWDVANWTPIREFQFDGFIHAVCFSHKGDCLAYWQEKGARVGVLSLETGSGDEPQLIVPQVNAGTALMFSPDDRFLICCSSAAITFDRHRMRVLDLGTGTDAEWGELLRTMALPVADGTLHGRSLGWAQLPRAHSLTTDSTQDAMQWVLYGAVGKRFVAVDIQSALHAIRDNAWRVDQLTFCATHQQEHVGSVLEAAPHCSNIRDMETGETVLHSLAHMHSVGVMGKWLEKCPHVTPVANKQGQTAVEVALQLEQADVAQILWRKLDTSLTSISAALVMQELRAMSTTHPHLVRPFLLDVEPKLVKTLATFRTDLTRSAEVCGLPTATLAGSSGDGKMQFQQESAIDGIPPVWADKCPADSPKTLVASKVVVLPHLLGDASSSPFHAIVTHCDASVFESKLLQLIVQHKWEENVSSQQMRSIALYVFAFVVGAAAMVTSVTNVIVIPSSIVNGLQGFVVVIEVSSLGVEAFELAHEGYATYFTGPWNLLDVVSSGFLLVGSACHFMEVTEGVRTAGALGVMLKCFGMVDYLRSRPATGSLVRMISVIMTDMAPFMTILAFAMLGCMLFFTINLSSSPEFDSDSSLGLFRTLVTVYHMTLGIGAGIDTGHASVTTVLVVTLFMSFVVVVLLNLLIAIMGDSYEKVKESERVEAIRERARIIVEQEKRFPKSHRHHRFMHFVTAVDSAETPGERMWEGVTKRVGQMLSLEAGRLEQELDDRMDSKFSKMDEKFSKMDKKIENKFSELDIKFQKVEHNLEMILERLK